MFKKNLCSAAVALVLVVPQVVFAGGGDQTYVPLVSQSEEVAEITPVVEKAPAETVPDQVEVVEEDDGIDPLWLLLGGVAGVAMANGGGSGGSKPIIEPPVVEPPVVAPPVTTTTATTTTSATAATTTTSTSTTST